MRSADQGKLPLRLMALGPAAEHPVADLMTRAQRSYTMSRIRSADTGPERAVRGALHRHGLRFRKHVTHLPGRQDIVFVTARVAAFVDGDFWHGRRFDHWSGTLSDFWREKIERNRARDRRNSADLRSAGWRVIRVWESRVRKDIDGVVGRVRRAVDTAPRLRRRVR